MNFLLEALFTSYTHPKWFRQTDIAGYQRLMNDFYDRKLHTTPWHGAPLTEESDPIKTDLRFLNEHGYVPFMSQPGWEGTWEGKQCYLRAKVEGICTAEIAAALMSLNGKDGILVAEIGHTQKEKRRVKQRLSTGKEEGDGTPDIDGEFFTYPAITEWYGWFGWRRLFPRKAKAFMQTLHTVEIMDTEWGSNKMWSYIEDVLLEAAKASR